MPEPIEELYVVIGSDISKLLKETKEGVGRVEKELKSFGTTAEKESTKASKGFKGISVGWAAIGAAITGAAIAAKKFFSESIDLARRQISAESQLANVLESTGMAAGLTADELKDLASEMQRLTNYGDEAVIESESLLLTFTQIGKDTFPRATKAILDVSTAMGQDLKTSTIQIGKALNDPIAGLGALSRVGIQFTEVQKEQIKAMTEAGNVAGAQAVILSELERQFGGSAEAARAADGGFIALKNSLGDLQEEVGKGVLEGLNSGVGQLSDKLADPATQEGLKAIASALGQAASSVLQVTTSGFIESLGSIDPESLDALAQSMTNAAEAISNIGGAESNLNGIIDALTSIIDAFTTIVNLINSLSSALPNISREIGKLVTPFGALTDSINNLSRLGDLLGLGGGSNSPAVPSFASGGSMFANKPTMVQFGEVPEVATFTPLSKMGGGPQRMEIDLKMSGSAPPGIRSGDRDQIAGVLLNALQEAGFDRASGGRGQ